MITIQKSLRLITFALLLIVPTDAVICAPAPTHKFGEKDIITSLRKPGVELTLDRRGRVVAAQLHYQASDSDFALLAQLPHLIELRICIQAKNSPTLAGLLNYPQLLQLKILIIDARNVSDNSYNEIKSKLSTDCLFFTLSY